MRITLIAAYDRQQAIGYRGRLPWHLPADLRRFRRLTWGKPCLMGRKTFEAIGRPLPGRTTVVLSRQRFRPATVSGKVLVFGSVEEALERLSDREEVMVIGGEAVFQQLLPRANALELTEIEGDFPGDTFFPAWLEEDWLEVERQSFPAGTGGFPYPYRFRRLIRKPA